MSEEPEAWRVRTPWWQSWKLLACLIALIPLAMPFVIRAMRLSEAAAIPEPFDVAAIAHVQIDPIDNAFEHYRRAAAIVAPMNPKEAEKYDQVDWSGSWQAVPEELVALLERNRKALEVFRAGTGLSDSLYNQPHAMTISTLLNVTQNLREFARLSQLEALRLADMGDLSGAWEWHRATLRASRHSGRHGCLIERLVGIAMHGTATKGITTWAADSRNDAAVVRAALADVRAIHRMTVPISENFKVEYFLVTNTLRDPRSLPANGATASVFGYVTGEPEYSCSVLKLLFANYLSQCDKPRPERVPIAPGMAQLYQLQGADRAVTGGRSAEQLESVFQKAFFARLMFPAIAQAIEAYDREQARRDMLELALALQVWHRDHGSFPASAEQVVGPELEKLPIDPYGKGAAIRYRLEPEGATVTLWSIGSDGVDDNGKTNPSNSYAPGSDLVLEVKAPRAKPATEAR